MTEIPEEYTNEDSEFSPATEPKELIQSPENNENIKNNPRTIPSHQKLNPQTIETHVEERNHPNHNKMRVVKAPAKTNKSKVIPKRPN